MLRISKLLAFGTFLTCFSSLTGAAPWEGPRKSEDDLRKIETPAGATYKPNDYRSLSIFFLHIAYADLFEEKKGEIAANLATAPALPAGPGLYGVAAVQGVHGGVNSKTNDALFALAIGVDVFSWLTRDRTREKINEALKTALDAVKQPALWLVKVTPELPAEADSAVFDNKIREEFLAGQSMLLSFPLKCDQTYFRATNPFGNRGPWGQYIEGGWQSRVFLCGHDNLDVSFNDAKRDLVNVGTIRTKEGKIISRVHFEKLTQNEGLKQHLKITDENRKDMARRLAHEIRPHVGQNWKIVYTAPNKSGDWKVFVVGDGAEVEFNLPDASL